jgi:Predicted membrane protein (DUF2306)
MTLKLTRWGILGVFSVLIALYPFIYLVRNTQFGLLNTKSADLLADFRWNMMFYTHISLGGLALLVGWTQFVPRWRREYLSLHRRLGKVYLLSVLLSGMAGGYIAFFATGGWIAQSGFMSLALVWLGSTLVAYFAIKKGQVQLHQRWMIYSFAACFAAVTLRIWLPLLVTAHQGSFIPAYRLVAWLCWVPNLVVAYFIQKNDIKT